MSVWANTFHPVDYIKVLMLAARAWLKGVQLGLSVAVKSYRYHRRAGSIQQSVFLAAWTGLPSRVFSGRSCGELLDHTALPGCQGHRALKWGFQQGRTCTEILAAEGSTFFCKCLWLCWGLPTTQGLQISFLPLLSEATEPSVAASPWWWALALRKGAVPPPFPAGSTCYNSSYVVKKSLPFLRHYLRYYLFEFITYKWYLIISVFYMYCSNRQSYRWSVAFAQQAVRHKYGSSAIHLFP